MCMLFKCIKHVTKIRLIQFVFIILLLLLFLLFPQKKYTDINSTSEAVINGNYSIDLISELGFNSISTVNDIDDTCVVIFDTGIEPHPDIVGSILYFCDFTSDSYIPYDDNGHGTAIAGLIAGNGKSSGGIYKGLAPNVNLIVLKVFNANGQTNLIQLEKGVEWLLSNLNNYNIKVVCMPLSFDSTIIKSTNTLYEKLQLLSERVITVTSSGNNGKINSPGDIKNIICVGSMYINNDSRGYKYNTPSFSASFLTRKVTNKPDVFVPGVDIIVLSNSSEKYTVMSGTSLSAAVLTGYIALIYQIYPDCNVEFVHSYLNNRVDDYGVLQFTLD